MNRSLLSVALCTLGCKVNQYESDKIADSFRSGGHLVVPFNEFADVYFINTCSVTHLADRKSRQIIRRAINRNPDALIVATGCYALDLNNMEFGRIMIIPNNQKNLARQLVEKTIYGKFVSQNTKNVKDKKTIPTQVIPVSSPNKKTRAFLKIQDGCNRLCTFCVIPLRRGKSISRPIDELVLEAKELEENGTREIIVTGICIGDYGKDLPSKPRLTDLLMALSQNLSLARIRLSSIDPKDLDDDLLTLFALLPNLCTHIHLSLQHISSKILRRMNRFYAYEDCRGLIEKLYKMIPNIGVSLDLMVGFPGETEEEFYELMDFVNHEIFCRLHVFPYSERSGTVAVRLKDKVPEEIKDARCKALIARGNEVANNYRKRFLGQKVTVLLEARKSDSSMDFQEGYSENYIRVRIMNTGEKVNVADETNSNDKTNAKVNAALGHIDDEIHIAAGGNSDTNSYTEGNSDAEGQSNAEKMVGVKDDPNAERKTGSLEVVYLEWSDAQYAYGSPYK